MKKLASIITACLFACVLFACSANNGADGGQDTIVAESSVEVLETIWAQCPESDRFPVVGGGYADPTDGAPGALDPSDTETLAMVLVVPEESASMLDDAASLVHAMNANVLTAGAFHFADPGDATAFEAAYQDAIMSNHWLCGAPQTLVIAHLGGGYMVTIFGDAGVAETVKGCLEAAYPAAEITVEKSL